ncbi:mechanosensitive ion channel family protein [Shewanella aestuarii]|uniref:Mechanosensing system component YbdG n=1 Tax=Shewanella aestuarii TaxID=1028752 RepID=A0A6G9QNW6_9GAMM|nr:mechanosensitive ion channel domain-containing protein [Shewanella aestuarii]QIR16290.1 mechanosensitive ion channel [Shewanella aestuarii]
MGLDSQSNEPAATWILLFGSLILAAISYYITRRFVVRGMNAVISRSKVTWDDVFMRFHVLERLAMLVPVILLDSLLPLIFAEQTLLSGFIDRSFSAVLVFLIIRAVYGALNAVNEIADINHINRRLPVKSFVQLIKLFLFFIGVILMIAALTDESPIIFFSGLGVATGLVMLVFRDTILGFVAGIQLAANRMVSKGDWIQMDKYGADGAVEDVTLTTVKVRNWDNTITMIPAYALVSDAFKNWRGMSESGGRRIKRAVNIDVNSIKFLSEDERNRLAKVNYLTEYLPKKFSEITEANQLISNLDMPVNGRRLTNIGTFRIYLQEFLRQHPKIHKDMTLMVRQLAPTTEGLPIELYIFTNDVRWAYYEEIQSDIFDHIFAVLPEFGLRAFQNPTGNDIRYIKPDS